MISVALESADKYIAREIAARLSDELSDLGGQVELITHLRQTGAKAQDDSHDSIFQEERQTVLNLGKRVDHLVRNNQTVISIFGLADQAMTSRRYQFEPDLDIIIDSNDSSYLNQKFLDYGYSKNLPILANDHQTISNILELIADHLAKKRNAKLPHGEKAKALIDEIEAKCTYSTSLINQTKRLLAPISSLNLTFIRALEEPSKPLTKLAMALPLGQNEIVACNLIKINPTNEQDLILDLIYAYADKDYRRLENDVPDLDFAKRQQTLKRLWSNPSSYQLTNVYAICELTLSAVETQDVAELDGVDLQAQPISPRLGYDTPSFITQEGLADNFDDAFDEALLKYSQSVEANHQHPWQHCLGGHYVRSLARLTPEGMRNLVSYLPHSHPITKVFIEQLKNYWPLAASELEKVINKV